MLFLFFPFLHHFCTKTEYNKAKNKINTAKYSKKQKNILKTCKKYVLIWLTKENSETKKKTKKAERTRGKERKL
ncbi:MAG: hypothetical protein ACLU5E_00430 [Anaerovoracaceae bacterium]|uniref:Uncharacterized protein n=1 Tax=Candidatus Allocopromorpha excrementavium TaxID=2840741 RepID=A0A9D1HBV1_9FIRM|nr:hypothetical protein [Candidatus Copromorpha excrementavium]